MIPDAGIVMIQASDDAPRDSPAHGREATSAAHAHDRARDDVRRRNRHPELRRGEDDVAAVVSAANP